MLDCDPHLNDTKELIHELNRTNGLFKFVRIVREKFQKAAACGMTLSLVFFTFILRSLDTPCHTNYKEIENFEKIKSS